MNLFHFRQQATDLLPAEPSLLYDVLTDYDSYFEWVPTIAKSKLLARERDFAIAEFDLIYPRKDKVVVECIHSTNETVIFRTITGNLPSCRTEWTIAAGEGGQSCVTLNIEAAPDWHWLLPAYRRLLNATRFLEALRLRTTAFLPDVELPGGGARIFEIVESNDGLVIWLRGRKYVLKQQGSSDPANPGLGIES